MATPEQQRRGVFGESFPWFHPGQMPWPLPAVLAWGLAWGAFRWAQGQGADPGVALGGAAALGVVLGALSRFWWRRLLIAVGFPVSLLLSMPGLAGTVPVWAWLVPLTLLLLVYPLKTWRDAPLFPTPPQALRELPRYLPLAAHALVLDAGCGLGHGLQAWHRAYPQARLHGLEWSWPLRWLCAWRCPWAQVRQGDIWQTDWSPYDVVYLFQRPESMVRASAKAAAELRAGAWLVSLEFEAAGWRPTAHYCAPGGKMVWMYQAPLTVSFGGPTT